MRKLLALAVLILTTCCALAENPRVFTSGGELVKLEALSGDLVLKGKMESEQPVFWFHLIFKNAAGKELFRMRLGDNQLIVPDNHGIAQLAEPLAARRDLHAENPYCPKRLVCGGAERLPAGELHHRTGKRPLHGRA